MHIFSDKPSTTSLRMKHHDFNFQAVFNSFFQRCFICNIFIFVLKTIFLLPFVLHKIELWKLEFNEKKIPFIIIARWKLKSFLIDEKRFLFHHQPRVASETKRITLQGNYRLILIYKPMKFIIYVKEKFMNKRKTFPLSSEVKWKIGGKHKRKP